MKKVRFALVLALCFLLGVLLAANVQTSAYDPADSYADMEYDDLPNPEVSADAPDAGDDPDAGSDPVLPAVFNVQTDAVGLQALINLAATTEWNSPQADGLIYETAQGGRTVRWVDISGFGTVTLDSPLTVTSAPANIDVVLFNNDPAAATTIVSPLGGRHMNIQHGTLQNITALTGNIVLEGRINASGIGGGISNVGGSVYSGLPDAWLAPTGVQNGNMLAGNNSGISLVQIGGNVIFSDGAIRFLLGTTITTTAHPNVFAGGASNLNLISTALPSGTGRVFYNLGPLNPYEFQIDANPIIGVNTQAGLIFENDQFVSDGGRGLQHAIIVRGAVVYSVNITQIPPPGAPEPVQRNVIFRHYVDNAFLYASAPAVAEHNPAAGMVVEGARIDMQPQPPTGLPADAVLDSWQMAAISGSAFPVAVAWPLPSDLPQTITVQINWRVPTGGGDPNGPSDPNGPPPPPDPTPDPTPDPDTPTIPPAVGGPVAGNGAAQVGVVPLPAPILRPHEGDPPQGIIMTPEGEIVGTPIESGEFRFSAMMPDGEVVPFVMRVLENTDENIDAITDEGFGFSIRVPALLPAIPEVADVVVVSEGSHTQFVGMWLNGVRLQDGVHFDYSPGSTRVTLRAQAFGDYAVQGRNTLAAEFRDTHANTLHTGAQNFVLARGNPPPPPSVATVSAPVSGEVRLQDTVLFVPGSTQVVPANIPSREAAEYVNRAIGLDIVPLRLRTNYAAAITRAEFAALAVAFYEHTRGAAVVGRMAFADSSDTDVQKAGYLGIMQPVRGTSFVPADQLTRAQAAEILTRLAQSLEISIPAAGISMPGDAQGNITRQEAIVALMRL